MKNGKCFNEKGKIADGAARPPEQFRLIGGGRFLLAGSSRQEKASKALLCRDIKTWINGMCSAPHVSSHHGLNHIYEEILPIDFNRSHLFCGKERRSVLPFKPNSLVTLRRRKACTGQPIMWQRRSAFNHADTVQEYRFTPKINIRGGKNVSVSEIADPLRFSWATISSVYIK